MFPYRAESYPPRGRMWPQFGDEVLEETLSFSDGARQNLNKKREKMSDFHKENLQRHGLAPREEPGPPPNARDVPVPMDEDDGAYAQPPSDPPDAPQGPGSQPRDGRRPSPQSPPDFARPGLPPGPPDTGKRPIPNYYMGDEAEPRVDLQGGLGKPPDFPGSGGAALRNRDYFRTTQPGPGGLNMNPMVQQVGGGGPPPPPPGAGGILIPHYAAGPEPLAAEVTSYQGPPGDPYDAAPLQPRARATPYDARPRVRVTGKKPDLTREFFATPPEEMDTAASTPAAIVPMEEQNTAPKRPNAPTEGKKKKKKRDEIAATQSPPSLPPPPPGGAATLKSGQREATEPDVEPASSASSAYAPTSVPHYRKKEAAMSSGYRKPPDQVIDDLPSVPVKRKNEKPLEDGTPAALRPDVRRPRAPMAEPDAEPVPLRVGSASSSSKGPSIVSRKPLM